MTRKIETKKVDGLQLIDEKCDAIAGIDAVIAYGKEALATVSGMKKAVMAANFVSQMRAALTPEIMGPIMALQGNGIGFRTDKDSAGGYPVEVVKGCLIEAAAMGLGAVGNQFNIISGRTYVTKEGAGQLLKNLGVRHSETCLAPEIASNQAKSKVVVEWKDAGGEHKETLEFLVRVNSGMGADAANGKATRKARMWLYGRITGMELADGDIDDAAPIDVTPKRSVFAKPEQPSEDPDYSPIINELARMNIDDISLGDIIAYHKAGNWQMNVGYICGHIVAVHDAVAAWKAGEASNAQ